MTSFAAPTAYPYAITYRAQYLWVGTTIGTPAHYIWKIHCPAATTVTPASLGKVKAMFK